ncbi:MAG: pseudouridine-5'-phosphate glycosidase [Actinomycetota bacterium]
MRPTSGESLRISDELVAALSDGTPIVALESTIFSGFGLPAPHNLTCYEECTGAIRAGGAVPALTAVIDGVARVGVEETQVERVLGGDVKVAARDIGHAVATAVDVGVTTVSATVTLAAAAGISVFATGGIGGVHRGAELSHDVSHDLSAMARHPVVTVSAGAKAFLDLAVTLEQLETLGVPVVGWKTDRFPAFYVPDSGLPVGRIVATGVEVASMLRASREVGHPGGILVANPIPAEDALNAARIDAAIDRALAEVDARGLRGPQVTPVVLGALAEATDGDSVPANLSLARNNARVATEIAVAVADG